MKLRYLFRSLLLCPVFLIIFFGSVSYAAQTIVFIRHGEKPDNQSGQLTCQGQNRALALPEVLISRFGNPDAIFASAPYQNKLGNSLRSLATVIPLAVRLSIPINLKYHATHVDDVTNELLSNTSDNHLTVVAWEHHNLVLIAKSVIKNVGGDAAIVPDKWPGSDFDSIFVLKIDKNNAKDPVIFSHEQEGLNGLSVSCPK
ncbi:histidine phosphatase family protein [Pectobacterium carotovorum]|uniref:histidine phosphatase family protein n=1 Tax=Pectobacterium carotovorum TaxID=554 RepID=UPI001F1C8098|nr:histidine phosphatase family protein [Pectobacterium carotovorum]